MGAGLLTMLCSLEVCVRLNKAKQWVQDSKLDSLINLHEVRHWMDPDLIPFGWGLFKEEKDEVMVIEKGQRLQIVMTKHIIVKL